MRHRSGGVTTLSNCHPKLSRLRGRLQDATAKERSDYELQQVCACSCAHVCVWCAFAHVLPHVVGVLTQAGLSMQRFFGLLHPKSVSVFRAIMLAGSLYLLHGLRGWSMSCSTWAPRMVPTTPWPYQSRCTDTAPGAMQARKIYYNLLHVIILFYFVYS